MLHRWFLRNPFGKTPVIDPMFGTKTRMQKNPSGQFEIEGKDKKWHPITPEVAEEGYEQYVLKRREAEKADLEEQYIKNARF